MKIGKVVLHYYVSMSYSFCIVILCPDEDYIVERLVEGERWTIVFMKNQQLLVHVTIHWAQWYMILFSLFQTWLEICNWTLSSLYLSQKWDGGHGSWLGARLPVAASAHLAGHELPRFALGRGTETAHQTLLSTQGDCQRIQAGVSHVKWCE